MSTIITTPPKSPAEKAACIIEGTSIAGTGRVQGLADLLATIKKGDRLNFLRDRENYFDEWAVKITDTSGNKLGFISCEFNEVVSRMMDAGFHVEGRFDSACARDGWTDIRIKVMLYA